MTEGVHACGAVGPGLLQEMLSKRQLGSPGLWVRPLSMSGGRKRGPVALLLPALGPHSQDRPCAQVKRNRAGREMTHPLLSLGSLPQQPSERNWAPKPRAGCAFSQQTRRAPPLPTAPPELRVPGPTPQEAVFPALRNDASGGRGPAPAPGLAHPSRNTQSASCPPPCTQGGPRTFLWGFLFKGPAVGGDGRKDIPGHDRREAGILQRAFHQPFRWARSPGLGGCIFRWETVVLERGLHGSPRPGRGESVAISSFQTWINGDPGSEQNAPPSLGELPLP